MACLSSFKEIVEAAKASPHEYRVQVSPAVWGNEVNSIVYVLLVEQSTDARIGQLGRLRVWARQVGAFDNGQASVDARLNECPRHIRGGIIKFLEDLKKETADIKTALSADPAEASGVIEPPETLKDTTDNTIDIAEMPDGKTKLQQLYGVIVNNINTLFAMAEMDPSIEYSNSIQNAR